MKTFLITGKESTPDLPGEEINPYPKQEEIAIASVECSSPDYFYYFSIQKPTDNSMDLYDHSHTKIYVRKNQVWTGISH